MKVVMNSMRLKEINIDLVKKALRAKEFGTKNSIAEATGLSVGTCKTILEELLISGEVFEMNLGPSTGGRPSRRFVYNENYAFAILLYARMEGNENSIYASIINMRGISVFEKYYSFDEISSESIDTIISGLISSYPKINAITIGVPGIVKNGRIEICDFKLLSQLPLAEYIHEKYALPVFVENDVNLTALGFFNRLDTISPESLVYIYYPKDGIVGAGIVINGEVVRGKNNFAGEVSYMPKWIEREKQGKAQKNTQLMSTYIIDTILSVNCLLNPECIVLCGQWFTTEFTDSIRLGVLEESPKGYEPEIIFETDLHNSYVDGLKFSALKLLTCGYEVVEK